MRAFLSLLLAASLLPATIAGAAWHELPSYAVPDGDAAACLRVSGDRVALIEQRGYDVGSALLSLSPQRGFAPDDSVDLGGSPMRCPAVGATPGGAAVVAAPLLDVPNTAGAHVLQSVATPGGGRPQALSRAPLEAMAPAVVATARDGSAVVAWVQRRSGSGRLMAARRPAATAPFGAPQQVAARIPVAGELPALAIDDAGRATLAWQTARGSHGLVANVARAAPGGPFGPGQRLGPTDWNDLSLTVAGDGRALVAGANDRGEGDAHEEFVVAWEAATPSAPFSRVAVDAPAEFVGGVALTADGAAVLAAVEDAGFALWRRPAGGAFGGREPIALGRAPRRSEIEAGWFDGGPDDDSDRPLSLRLAPSGRFLLTWALPATGAAPGRAAAVSGTLAGGIDGQRPLGNVCRTVSGAATTQLADGTLAAVWADDGTVSTLGDREERRAAGRVGAVLAGVTPPAAQPGVNAPVARVAGSPSIAPWEPAPQASAPPLPARASAPVPAPRIHVRLLDDRRLGATEPLRLRVRCVDGPCEVRASAWAYGVRGKGALDRLTWAASAASASLAEGRERTLRLRALPRSAFVSPREGGAPAIAVSSCTARGNESRTTTLRPRLNGRPLPAPPRVVAFDAQRRGDRVRVSWRLSKPLGRGSEWSIVYGNGSHTGGGIESATRVAHTIRYQGAGPLTLRLSTRLAADVVVRETRVR